MDGWMDDGGTADLVSEKDDGSETVRAPPKRSTLLNDIFFFLLEVMCVGVVVVGRGVIVFVLGFAWRWGGFIWL
jgi:hypothetical protein